MNELQVRVKFSNITIVGGAEIPGIVTPVRSFTLNGFIYKVDTNGQVYPESTTTGGDTYRYLTYAGTKFRYTNDINGVLYPESSSSVSTENSFWLMIDDNNVIWIIGADNNGEFTSQYLQ